MPNGDKVATPEVDTADDLLRAAADAWFLEQGYADHGADHGRDFVLAAERAWGAVPSPPWLP